MNETPAQAAPAPAEATDVRPPAPPAGLRTAIVGWVVSAPDWDGTETTALLCGRHLRGRSPRAQVLSPIHREDGTWHWEQFRRRGCMRCRELEEH